MLLRDWIGRALADGRTGYFARRVVARASPLDFAAMSGERQYRDALAGLYGQTDTAWLTPAEIFQPHYAEAIARSLVARHARAYGAAEPLQIVEVGGGNGTAALGILDYLRREEPYAFATCRYLSLEVSPLLAEVQRQRLADAGVGSDTFTVVHAPFDEWRGRLTDGVVDLGGPWHAVALEVLDNLPHDKIRLIRRHAPRDADADADGYATDLYEARVTPPPPSAPPTSRRGHESWEPLADELLTRVVSIIGLDTHAGVDSLEEDMLNPPGSGIAGEFTSGAFGAMSALIGFTGGPASSRDVFVPTGAYRLLRFLADTFTEHQLTLADFSYLPPQPSGAPLAPVVQRRVDGVTRDLGGDYLASPGEADIMAPTHFPSIAAMHAACGGRHEPSIHSTREFMARYHHDAAEGGRSATATASGYDPMVDDFVNTALLLTGERTNDEA